MRPSRFEDRVALVTGGGQGIGRAIAARFIEEGARVLILEKERHAAEDAAAEFGEALRSHVGSAADEATIERAVREAVAWGGRLDVLVNNAAIARAKNASLEELALADWQAVVDTNLTGPMLCAKHAARTCARRAARSSTSRRRAPT